MSRNKRNCPIGVFDSGLGGLTVVRALTQALPAEDIVYFGDTARVPYGTKSRESIIRFSKENVSILLRHSVKIIVVACNSSSSYALAALQKMCSVPVIGVIDPGVKKAISVTRNNTVGVIATPATINSNAYTIRIKTLCRSIKVITQPCPLFVPLVEAGWVNKKATKIIAQEYMQKIKHAHADTVILGCTHYPLLKHVLRQVLGSRVKLIDSAQEVARDVKLLLMTMGMTSDRARKGRYQFLVSDEPEHFSQSAKKFLGYTVGTVKRVG